MTVFGGELACCLGLLLFVSTSQFSVIMITPHLPYPVTIKPNKFCYCFCNYFSIRIIASKIASSRITKAIN